MTIVSVHRSMTRHFTTFPLWYTEWIRDFSTEPWEVALPNTQSLPCYVSWGSNWNKVWKKKWRGHHAPERRSILPWACHSNFWFFIAATRKKRIGKREGKKKKIKEKNPSHFHFSRISLPSHPWWCLFLRFFIQYTFVFFFPEHIGQAYISVNLLKIVCSVIRNLLNIDKEFSHWTQ